ncbi:MAG: GNAT family N-acetyltransferase [Gaiellaceae bacterium]
MSGLDVRLRPATMADAELLLSWRNDPATRAASFNEGEVSLEAHVRWLAGKLDAPECALLIVEDSGQPVGQVRLEREGDAAEIHIALAPAARGRSIGRRALHAAVALAPGLLDVRTVAARVKQDNEASLRAFEAAGFQVVGTSGGVVELAAEA